MRYFLVLFFLFLSCSKTENTNNFSLRVEVDGLKKGTLFLEKFSDSGLFKIDSGYFNGNNSVEFKGKIEGPEIMILSLTYENELVPKQLPFFVEKSEMIVKTRLKDFGYKVYSKGSKNDSIYRQYLVIKKKFNNLRIIKHLGRTNYHSLLYYIGKNKKGFCVLSITIACQPKDISKLEKSKYSLDDKDKLPLSLIYNCNINQ